MIIQKVGCIRVSSLEQNMDRSLDDIELDKIVEKDRIQQTNSS